LELELAWVNVFELDDFSDAWLDGLIPRVEQLLCEWEADPLDDLCPLHRVGNVRYPSAEVDNGWTWWLAVGQQDSVTRQEITDARNQLTGHLAGRPINDMVGKGKVDSRCLTDLGSSGQVNPCRENPRSSPPRFRHNCGVSRRGIES
jgi:hypothetical protein